MTFHKSDVQIVQQCDLFIYLFNLFNLFKIQRSCELRSSLEAVKLHYFLKFQFFFDYNRLFRLETVDDGSVDRCVGLARAVCTNRSGMKQTAESLCISAASRSGSGSADVA